MADKKEIVSGETRKDIIRAAEYEFAEKGFRGASLRKITGDIGMTTGAVYFFFSGKDELFYSVIRQVTEPFMTILKKHYKSELEYFSKEEQWGKCDNSEILENVLDLYFNHKTVWKIITDNPEHEAVKKYVSEFISVSAEHYSNVLSIVKQYSPKKISADKFDIEQFVCVQLNVLMSLASSDFERDEMRAHMNTSIRMMKGAFYAMIKS